MKYRNLRQKSTGRWVDVLLTSAGEFSVKLEDHLVQVAKACPIPVADLELLESEADQRTGIKIAQLPVARPLPTTDEILVNAIKTATTVDDVKMALIKRFSVREG